VVNRHFLVCIAICYRTDALCLVIILCGPCNMVDYYCAMLCLARYMLSSCICPFVCVCVSVALRYCIKTAKRRIAQIMPHDRSGTILTSASRSSLCHSRASCPKKTQLVLDRSCDSSQHNTMKLVLEHPAYYIQGAPIKNNPLEKMLYFSHDSMDLSLTFRYCVCVLPQHTLQILLKYLI